MIHIAFCLLLQMDEPKKEFPIVARFMGGDSMIQRTDCRVIRTPADWKRFWKEHQGSADAPAVDFDKHMACVTLRRVRGECDVTTLSVREDADGLKFNVHAAVPPKDADPNAPARTAFGIAIVPRSEKKVDFWFNRYPWGIGCGEWDQLVMSPTGNGYLVYNIWGKDQLITYSSPSGDLLAKFGRSDLLSGEELIDELDLKMNLAVSADGYFAVARAPVTGRAVRFFLPTGQRVEGMLKSQIDAVLEPPTIDVKTLVGQLEAESLEVRDRATQELMQKGIHHFEILEQAMPGAASDALARLKSIVDALRPLKPLVPLAKTGAFRESLRK